MTQALTGKLIKFSIFVRFFLRSSSEGVLLGAAVVAVWREDLLVVGWKLVMDDNAVVVESGMTEARELVEDIGHILVRELLYVIGEVLEL